MKSVSWHFVTLVSFSLTVRGVRLYLSFSLSVLFGSVRVSTLPFDLNLLGKLMVALQVSHETSVQGFGVER